MSVREQLDLDIRRSLSDLDQIDRKLTGAARSFTSELNRGIGNLSGARIDVGGLGATRSGLAQLGPESDKAAAAMFRYQTEVQKAREAERLANAERQRSEQALGRVATAAGIAGAAIAVGVGMAVKSNMDFERSISLVGAVSDANSKQLDRYRDAAIEAGAATIFSARDAAEAEAELAKAGLTTAEILNGGLRGALDLAAAGQLDLAEAATISAQAMQIFGLSGTDVTHIADVLAAGANKSTASVQSLGQGLGNVGGTAKLAGLSLEETVGVLALLDQNAVKGAEGGTALKSALLQLFTPSKQQREEMERLGLSIYDTGGNFIGLERLAGELQSRFGHLSEAERNASMGIIFGSFGIQAATALYKEGADGVREYINAVDDQGAAARFSGKQLDNLSGDLEQLKGSIETALIQTGGQGNTALRFMAQGATATVNAFTELPAPIQAAGSGLVVVSGAALLGFAAFEKLKPLIESARTSFDNLSPSMQTAASTAGRVAVGLGALTVGATSFQAIGDSAAGSVMGIVGMTAAGAALGSVIPGVGTGLGAAAGAAVGFGKAIFEAGESTEEFNAKIDALIQKLQGLGAQRSAKVFLDEIGESADDMKENFRAAGESIEEWADRTGKPISIARSAIDDAGDQVEEFSDKFAALAKKNPAQAEAVLKGLREIRTESGKMAIPEDVIAKLEKDLARGEAAYARTAERTRETNTANQELATGGMAQAAQAAEAAAKAYEDYIKGLSSGTPSIVGFFDEASNAARNLMGALDPNILIENLQRQAEGVANFTTNVKLLMSEGLTDLAAIVASKGPVAGAELATALANATPEVRAAIEASVDAGNAELQNWNDYISGTLGPQLQNTSFAAGFGVGTGTQGGITAGQPGVAGAAQTLAAHALWNLGEITNTTWLGRAAADGLAEGINQKIGEIGAAAATAARSAIESARNALGVESPSKVMRQIGRWTAEGLALGIDDGGGAVGVAGRRLGTRAVSGVMMASSSAAGSSRAGGPGGLAIGSIDVQVVGVSDPKAARAAGVAAGEGLAAALGGQGVGRRKITTAVRTT